MKRLKFKVTLPQEQLRQSFPKLEITGTDKACSGCLIPLLSNLLLLGDQGARLDKPLRICLGKNPEIPKDRAWLLIGDCAQTDGVGGEKWVAGCPPSREDVLNVLKQYIS